MLVGSQVEGGGVSNQTFSRRPFCASQGGRGGRIHLNSPLPLPELPLGASTCPGLAGPISQKRKLTASAPPLVISL